MAKHNGINARQMSQDFRFDAYSLTHCFYVDKTDLIDILLLGEPCCFSFRPGNHEMTGSNRSANQRWPGILASSNRVKAATNQIVQSDKDITLMSVFKKCPNSHESVFPHRVIVQTRI